MRLVGNVPRNALERLFDLLGSLPEAQYEHEQRVVPQRESAPVPLRNDDPTEASKVLNPNQEISLPPPQPTQPVEGRTGNLSRFGQFTKQILPAMIRGAAVGVSNPVKGDTGAQIFGTMRNVEADQRDTADRSREQAMQNWQWHRQMRKDDESSQLHGAQMDNYRALARQRNAQADKPPAAAKPTFASIYDDAYARAKKAGLDDIEAHGHAMAAWNRNPTGFIRPDPKNVEGFEAAVLSQFQRGDLTPEEFEDAKQRIIAMKRDIAKGQAEGKASGTPIQSKTLLTDQGIGSYFPGRMKPTGETISAPKIEQTGVKPPAPRATQPRAPQRPRLQRQVLDDNTIAIVNLDTGEVKRTNEKAQPPSSKGVNIEGELQKILGGGGAAPSANPQVKKGDIVTLRNGRKITVKKVNPDGTFE
jgi:hypothetical protein